MKMILVPPIQYLPREYLEKWIRACVKRCEETNPTGSRCRCTKIETEAGFRIVVVVADSEAVTIGFHTEMLKMPFAPEITERMKEQVSDLLLDMDYGTGKVHFN